ncbi:Mo-dependent nitrogenase C-terminal domain-containing protein [Halomicronema sp. CCY15110]|uniref:Mo-dependent nitrogenase C-terminal domain-containing protein n=1 Tax=Halomicronema sp. CCY15110 TaxID=2767773 RepID=UPI001950DD77|nr:Mo-dependent nitrogenase C-terminal domain-containing protein [Halomicronema sp. CCY15110]
MLHSSIRKLILTQPWQSQLRCSRDVFRPWRQWLNHIELRHPTQAHLICQLIPAQCPFEREVRVGPWLHIQVPPLCKLNPLYEEVVSLRFRALCYLAEECAVDICRYC